MRLLPLDFLRGLAILLVIGRHKPFLYVWYKVGWIGVDLFFVLSGFLIAGLLFSEFRRSGTIRVGRFYLRRGFKIYPGFYLLILLTPLIFRWTGQPFTGRQLGHELLFIQNYFVGLYRHTWSLAIEEHFYLLLPLLLLALRHGARRRANPFTAIPRLFAVVAVTLLAARFITFSQIAPFRFETHFFPTHLRSDALLFGVLLSYLCHFHDLLGRLRPWHLPLLTGLGILLIIPSAWFDLTGSFITSIGLTGLYLGFGALLLVALKLPLPARGPVATLGRWFAKPIATVGIYSYSIYLWHMGVSHWVRLWYQAHYPAGWNRGFEFAAYVIVSLGLGILMARLVEFPLLHLRDRCFPSPSRSLAPPAAAGK